ncbi:protein FAM200A-like [Homalodisca vitripennis]|uniref:protein FAM200A-like n=1 Tax=Homalodisca vitripennis TaxID=197043 RepID=UPI001EEA5472|nr:protein FAM200A-like [Homalodisca vitripennis]
MYVEKLKLWILKVSMNPSNYSSFSKVVSVSEEVCFEDVFEGPLLKNLIIDHLKNLKEEFSRYFPNLSEELYKLSTDPFNMDIQLLPEELQEEGIEIKNDSVARYDFDKMDKPSFWLKYLKVLPQCFRESCSDVLVIFNTTYMCEKAFSTLVAIKTKYRNKLDVESDLRCALSETQPRICQLIQNMQAHPISLN